MLEPITSSPPSSGAPPWSFRNDGTLQSPQTLPNTSNDWEFHSQSNFSAATLFGNLSSFKERSKLPNPTVAQMIQLTRNLYLSTQEALSSEFSLETVLFLAQLYRKLAFIEEVLGIQLSVPKEIPLEEVTRVDTIFRGITRGIVFADCTEITIFKPYPPDIDLKTFLSEEEPRSIIFESEETSLFGQKLPVGPISIFLLNAVLANPEIIDQVQNLSQELVPLKFQVWDNRAILSFTNHKGMHAERQQQLENFINNLANQEPKELANLVAKPINGEISANEALEIALSALYSLLSESSQTLPPEYDSTTDSWAIHIGLPTLKVDENVIGCTYHIDRKTGKTINAPIVFEPQDLDSGSDLIRRTREILKRACERHWFKKNQDKFAGQWVALFGPRLLSHGPNAREVIQKARQLGIKIPLVVHIPPSDALPFGGW